MRSAAIDLNRVVLAQETVLTDTPAASPFGLPVPIAAGMRWTLWLSLLTIPFSYITSFLLARIGPEALGTLGVLNVYIGLVFVFLFLGGCAVPMKFLPELDADHRASFLTSYTLILLVGLVPWMLLATLWPQLLEFLFGRGGDARFQLLLMYLSPVCLAHVVMVSCLKAIMEMKWAQLLDRGITVGLATVLLILFICSRAWLKLHAADTVWLTYIGLSFAFAVIAFYRLVSLGWLTGRRRLWVPSRFWPYTLLLQSGSLLNFFGTKLDYLFVLNGGGIVVLGKYVAITSIAAIVPRVSGFVADSLLPSLTNCLAAGDRRSAVTVAETCLRLIFPTVLGLSLTASVFVRPVLAIMGPQYFELAPLVQVACLIAAIQSLNVFSGTIFTATDRVQHSVAAGLVRTLVFAGFFWPLWARMQLTGAVVSWGLAEVIHQVVSLYLLQRNPVLRLRFLRSYTGFAAALVLWILPARCGLRAEYGIGGLLLCLTLLAFLVGARYTTSELRGISHLITNRRT